METFYNWLIGELGNPGEFRYQAIHIDTVLAVLAAAMVFCWLSATKRLSAKQKRACLVGLSAFQLGFEIVWRLVFYFVKGDTLQSLWPLYPCNLNGVLIPIIALMGWEKGKKLFYLFGFVGGVLTFGLPLGIFNRDVMVFPILKSILQHTGVVLIPLFEFAGGTFRPRLKHMGWVIAGLLVHLVNGEGISRLLGYTGDYMYFRSGMPFVIPGVPQYITLSVFALLVLSVLSLLSGLFDRYAKRRSAAPALPGK